MLRWRTARDCIAASSRHKAAYFGHFGRFVEDYERELTSVNASIATLEKNMLELGYDLPVKLPGLSPFWWPWS